MTSVQISPTTNDNTEYKYDSSCIHKRNVVLDLDETLISGKACDEDIDFEKDKEQLMKFKFHNMDDLYLISERPGVQDFLTELFKNYIVSVWTAASKDYALFIIENVLLNNPKDTPPRQLKYIFWSDHGSISKKLYDKKPKKLSLLWDIFRLSGFDPYNTIIVDDYEKVTQCQPANAIRIAEFDCTRQGHEHDTELCGMCATLDDKFKILKESRPKSAHENTELDKIKHRTLIHKVDCSDSDDDSDSDSDDDDDDDDDISANLKFETDAPLDVDVVIKEVPSSLPVATAAVPLSDSSDNESDNVASAPAKDISVLTLQAKEALAKDISDLTISEKALKARTLNVDTESTTDDDSPKSGGSSSEAVQDSPIIPASPTDVSATQHSITESKSIDLSEININEDLQKAATQNLAESMEKLRFSEEKVEVEDGAKSNFIEHDQQAVTTAPQEGQDKATILENIQAATKHKFDKGAVLDEDDDEDGESKRCSKCKEDFITYSGKDHCPECR